MMMMRCIEVIAKLIVVTNINSLSLSVCVLSLQICVQVEEFTFALAK